MDYAQKEKEVNDSVTVDKMELKKAHNTLNAQHRKLMMMMRQNFQFADASEVN